MTHQMTHQSSYSCMVICAVWIYMLWCCPVALSKYLTSCWYSFLLMHIYLSSIACLPKRVHKRFRFRIQTQTKVTTHVHTCNSGLEWRWYVSSEKSFFIAFLSSESKQIVWFSYLSHVPRNRSRRKTTIVLAYLSFVFFLFQFLHELIWIRLQQACAWKWDFDRIDKPRREVPMLTLVYCCSFWRRRQEWTWKHLYRRERAAVFGLYVWGLIASKP